MELKSIKIDEPKKLKPHPFSEMFPRAVWEDEQNIRNSIREHGLRHSIKIFEGMTLEGNQRLRICLEIGVNAAFEEFIGTRQEALDYSWDENAARRNLTPHERQLALMKRSELENLLNLANNVPTGTFSTGSAEKVGVKPRSAARLRKLMDHGTEHEKDDFREGKVSLHQLDDQITKRQKGDGDSELVDKMGHPIPEGDASYYWRRRSEAEELLALITKAGKFAKTFRQDDIMWINMDVDSLLSELRSAAHRVKWAGIPRYVCTRCKGKKPVGCKACSGRGVIPEMLWKFEPEELKC